MSRYNIHVFGVSADHGHRKECGSFPYSAGREEWTSPVLVCLHRATSSPSHVRDRILVSTQGRNKGCGNGQKMMKNRRSELFC